jgi:hypothetical protein
MSEVKKKIIINHEHLNPNSQKRGKNCGGNSGSSGRTLKKIPGFVRPSELKNNLIKLLKQKREEKQQQQQQRQQQKQHQEQHEEQHQKQNEKQDKKEREIIAGISDGGSITSENDKPLFDKKKYENIFSKDFEESLNYLKSFKQNNHRGHSTTKKHKHFSNAGNPGNSDNSDNSGNPDGNNNNNNRQQQSTIDKN